MNVTFVVAVIVLVVIGMTLVDWTTKRRVQRHLAGRPSRSDEEFDREFFPELGNVASRFRRLLRKYPRLDLAGLGPDDRPTEDLRLDDFDSLATVNLLIDVEKEFGIAIKDSDASKLKTVRDIVECIARQLDEDRDLKELQAAKVTEGGEPTTPLKDGRKELGLNE